MYRVQFGIDNGLLYMGGCGEEEEEQERGADLNVTQYVPTIHHLKSQSVKRGQTLMTGSGLQATEYSAMCLTDSDEMLVVHGYLPNYNSNTGPYHTSLLLTNTEHRT